MKTVLKIIGIIFGSILSLVLIIWLFPQLVITTKTVKWAAAKQTAIQFEPAFPADFEIKVRNSMFVKQRIELKATNFCIKTSDQSLHACFNTIDIATTINFKKFTLMFDSLGPFIVDGQSIDYKVIESKEPKKAEKKSDNPVTFPDISPDFELNHLRIRLPNIVVDTGKDKINASVSLIGEKPENGNYQLGLLAKASESKDPKNFQVKFLTEITPEYAITGTLHAYAGSDGKKPKVELDTKIDGHLTKVEGELTGKLIAANVAEFLPLVEIYKFHIVKKESLKVEGDFNLEFLAGTLDPHRSALPPPELKTKFSGKVEAERSKNKPITFDIAINPLEQYGFETSAKTKGKFDTKTSQLHLDTLKVDLVIKEFQKTVYGLRKTQMAIPAPINDLKGTVELHIGEDNISSKAGVYKIPVKFQTNLTSTKQAIIIDTAGKIDVKPQPFEANVDLNVDLNDIAIALPDFDPISKIPNVVGDKRFVSKKEKLKQDELFDEKKEKKVESPVKIDIKVDTPKKPIRIYYKLFKPYAVFRVKTHISDGPPDFSVDFEPFTVEYLKRAAKLERLKIQDDPKAESIMLDGRFSIKKADYLIYADIHQENKKSYITLTSEPPLSEEDIVSLILFNELSTNLDTTSTDSVQDTQAAMTKKTIGFFSFFVLASTPIESVNYDPTTQQYSARVKLPGGFTGTVGSDWDKSQEVGLRKRLGGKWVISATVGTDTEGEQRQETMIEWYHRY